MNPLLDQILVFGAILGAIAFFVIRAVRSRRKNSCSSGCGCGAASKANLPIAKPR